MLRKLMFLGAAVVLASSTGLFFGSVSGPFGGPTHALAAGGNGVGPSSTDATGQARACEAHAANKGESKGNGFSCGPTFSVSVNGRNLTYPQYCDLQFTGTGLPAGAQVFAMYPLTPISQFAVEDNLDGTLMTVPTGGVLNDVGPAIQQEEYVFFVNDASGNPLVTYDLKISC